MNNPTFSLCHATARLPSGWIAAYEDWIKKADHPLDLEYLLCVDSGRVTELDWPNGATVRAIDRTNIKLVINRGRRCAVDAWNATARASIGKFLITVSDDYFPPEHWDTAILSCVPNIDDEYVLDVDNQDGAGNILLPFSFLTRAYLDRLEDEHGYEGFFHPGYFGMGADWDFGITAQKDGVVINARKVLHFKHLNPENGEIEWDDTYRWQRRQEAQDTGHRLLKERHGIFFQGLAEHG